VLTTPALPPARVPGHPEKRQIENQRLDQLSQTCGIFDCAECIASVSISSIAPMPSMSKSCVVFKDPSTQMRDQVQLISSAHPSV